MTVSELEQRLSAMSATEKAEFLKGIGNLSEDKCLELFGTNRVWEAKICRALGVIPQEDKVGKATIDAALYAKLAFIAAIFSIVVSAIALFK